MIRTLLYLAMTSLAIVIWFAMKNELANFVALGMMLFVGGVAIVALARGAREVAWKTLAVIPLVSLVAMVIAMCIVRREADAVAHDFISRYRCRPNIAELKADAAWRVDSGHATREIDRFGAVRQLTYQMNGLFRYGFLHDKQRTVWLPACR